jgi:predicted nucleotidyltransferase
MLPHQLSEKIISELEGIFQKDLCSVILFGSYAKGIAQTYSDIDILIILNRKFTIWTDRRDLEIELRKRLYRTIGQVSPKTASIEELEMALENLNPLILNIIDSGITLFDNGTFAKLKKQFDKIVPGKVIKHPDYWEVVEA